MPTAYCAQSDLEIALGSADALRQLADPLRTGTADPSRVTDYLESGAARIRGIIEVKYEPESIAALDGESQRFLRDLNKWFSAQTAWLEGGRGQAIPERVEKQADWADGELRKIATGERRLGRVAGGAPAALGQFAGTVDFDRQRDGISVGALRQYGFR